MVIVDRILVGWVLSALLPFVNQALMTEIEEQILVPTVHGMRRRRTPFHGILYAGLMLTSQGPKVLEFNVRFGDPECQALCIRLESSLLELIDAAVDRRLNEIAVTNMEIWSECYCRYGFGGLSRHG